jgi:predicted dienelactone hydrolase
MRGLFLFLVALGCREPTNYAPKDAETVDPLSWSVTEPGPFETGYQTWSLNYALGGGFDDRSIRVHLWYPTADESGPSAAYTVGTDSEVFADAVPAAPVHGDGYPVHIHSHGDFGLGAGSVFLSRYLSSHGWISISVDHAGNTLLDATADPQVATFFHRPLDIRAALDAVDAEEIALPLAGRANTERVVLSGHSRGAYTTWATLGARYDVESVSQMCATGDHLDGKICSAEEEAMFATDLSDPRVVATIPLDGTLRREWFGERGEESVGGPVLYFSPTDSSGSEQQFESLADIDFTWVRLDGACHQSFANGGCTTLDTEQGFHIVRTLVLAFSRIEIIGDTSDESAGFVSGDIPISELVTTVHR